MSFPRIVAPLLAIALIGCTRHAENQEKKPLVLQLNWLHDPTFTGEYFAAEQGGLSITLREGGANLSPIGEIQSSRADLAIVGADIFLMHLDSEQKAGRTPQIACIFADFQRNPVGWILHPDAAEKLGYSQVMNADQKKKNAWLFEKINSRELEIGDKRGTETTSIWMQWKRVHNVPNSITVVPVGFDASVVLSAPRTAYPIYLNEEPYKLSDKIGRAIVEFDPAVDGVRLYGNVVICAKSLLTKRLEYVRQIQNELRAGWQKAQQHPKDAVVLVSKYYKGVSTDVLNKQIARTLEFVYYQNNLPGSMDVSADGRWQTTISALKDAEVVSESMGLEQIKEYIVAPQ